MPPQSPDSIGRWKLATSCTSKGHLIAALRLLFSTWRGDESIPGRDAQNADTLQAQRFLRECSWDHHLGKEERKRACAEGEVELRNSLQINRFQLTQWGALRLGWPFRNVPPWGEEIRHLYLCIPAIECRLPWKVCNLGHDASLKPGKSRMVW